MKEMRKGLGSEMKAEQAMKERQERYVKRELIKAERLEVGRRALDRLLMLAKTQRSGQIERIALFIGACWNGRRHFDFFDFRSLDWEIQEDMFAVLLAHATGYQDIEHMLPDANERIIEVLELWGMYGPDQTSQVIATRNSQ